MTEQHQHNCRTEIFFYRASCISYWMVEGERAKEKEVV